MKVAKHNLGQFNFLCAKVLITILLFNPCILSADEPDNHIREMARQKTDNTCDKWLYLIVGAVGLTSGAGIIYLTRAIIHVNKEIAHHKEVISRIKKALEEANNGNPTLLSLNGFAKRVFRDGKWYPHIGYGIYLDIDKIESILTPHERKLLLNPIANAEAIATLFNFHLYGGEDDDDWEAKQNDAITYRAASSFFSGQSKKRGDCKHKSVILVALMRHYGTEARLVSGILGEGKKINHDFAYLPTLKRSADPVNSRILFPIDRHYRQPDNHIRAAWNEPDKDKWNSPANFDDMLNDLLNTIVIKDLKYSLRTHSDGTQILILKRRVGSSDLFSESYYYGQDVLRVKAVLQVINVQQDPVPPKGTVPIKITP